MDFPSEGRDPLPLLHLMVPPGGKDGPQRQDEGAGETWAGRRRRAKPQGPGRELVRRPELGQQEEGGFHCPQEAGPGGGEHAGEGRDPMLRDTGGYRGGTHL